MGSHQFLFNDAPVDATVVRDGDLFAVTVAGATYQLRQIAQGLFRAEVEGRRITLAAVYQKGTWYVDIDSLQLELTEPGGDGFAAGAADTHAGAKDKVFAPMPGKIVKIMVAVGDEVDVKQPMVIVEAMKMENQVNSRARGKVRAVNFKAGDQVDTERPIIELDVAE